MRYIITTFGCQMNVHDSEKIAGMLTELGYQPCDKPEDADVIVVNTCCIRDTAEKKAISSIGELRILKNRNKNLIVAVCGCMPQAEGNAQKLKEKFPFIDIIFGTHNLHCFKDYLIKRMSAGKKITEIWPKEAASFDNVAAKRGHNISAFVNITMGCDNFCSYCIVPYVRGRERSRPHKEIIDEIKSLLDNGYKEIMLLGQNVNSYNDGGVKFYRLLEMAASAGSGFRLRFMTSHPKDFDDNVIAVINEHDTICNHVHLPLQSGSDKILKLMNRKYTSADYLKIIDKIYKDIPDCGITSDIMVGFPGESEQDFNDTLETVKKARFNGCYMFVFSPRAGTAAARMENQISADVKKQRIMRLIAAQNEVTRQINKEKYLNNVFGVLCDGKLEKKELYCGKTQCGRLVSFKGSDDLLGKFLNVKITKTATAAMYGEITDVKEV